MSEAPHLPPDEPATAARNIAEVQKKQNLYRRVTSSVPLLVTVIVHLVLVAIAGAVVVQQNITGKKKILEAAASTENTAQKQVEHRLQVARRGGASGASGSPVEVDRVFSTADTALQLPPLPDLPALGGPSGFGGFGGAGSGVGMGAGTGMATSLGGGVGLGGRGFMSMSFLGITDQNVQNVVFIVDVGSGMMDLRKSGFRAFEIIRNEMGSLIGRLPPAARFNVLLFGPGGNTAYGNINPFRPELVPATTDNKEAFFAWMKPVNTDHQNLGPRSAAVFKPWVPKPLPDGYGFDPTINTINRLVGLIQAGIEQQPDTIFLITGQADLRPGRRPASPETLRKHRADWDSKSDERRKQRAEYEKNMKDLAARGLTPASIDAARNAAAKKAEADFAEANKQRIAAGKPPIVNINGFRAIHARLDELKKAGMHITIDERGWKVDNEGKPITVPRPPGDTYSPITHEEISWNDVHLHISRLQRALTPQKVAISTMLFVGPDDSEDKVEDWSAPLREVSKRNDGKFQVLTTKRLEEILAASRPADGT
jgi:hypothetical protein